MLTDHGGARRIVDRFDSDVTRTLPPPTALREGSIRSHYGELSLGGVPVDVLGDVQLLEPDRGPDEWRPVVDPRQREYLTVGGPDIPALPPSYERRCYTVLCPDEKLALLAASE